MYFENSQNKYKKYIILLIIYKPYMHRGTKTFNGYSIKIFYDPNTK